MARTIAHANVPIPEPNRASPARARWSCAVWVALAASIGAAISWAACDRLRWSREVFLVPYVAAAALLWIAFVDRNDIDVLDRMRRHPIRALSVTLLAGALLARSVYLQPGGFESEGSRLAFELLWDGVAYGAADGLLLTVLPMTAVRDAFERASQGPLARVGVDVLAIAASLVVFVAYHLGFPEFRGPLLVWPVAAGLVFGVTYLAAGNPFAPVVAHVVMHVAAVLHGPAGTLQLPPHY